MKLIQIFDSHWRDEEPFFVAAKAMSEKLVKEIQGISGDDEFVLVHGGDVFHRSKETGRVNGIVLQFFMSVLNLAGCKGIYIIQGNHDVKKETGSALDYLSNINSRLKVVKEPTIIPISEEKYLYALPHMPAYTMENFKGIGTYGEPEFHTQFFQDTDTNKIIVTVGHFGDETSGDFFKQVDTDFVPGVKCNGHIHKRVSDHYPGSIMITRRDEIDKISYMRVFDIELEKHQDIPVSCAFNYLKIKFGEDMLKAYEAMEVKPYGSVIIDISGHDNEEAVISWFAEQQKIFPIPSFLGSIYPDEKQSDGDYEIEVAGEEKVFDIKSLFTEFCKEKGVDQSIKERIEAVL